MTATLCFVGARRGNAFMNELLAAIAHEVEAAGMPTELAFDALPEDGARVYVLVPHEYYECVREEHHPTRAQLGRTIAFCTEQPGTHWFDLTRAYAASAGAAVDIYPDAVRELGRRGLRAEHFRLGYSGFWDRWERDERRERPIDVLHLGTVNERRLRALAGYAGTLWPHRTRLLVPPEKPKTGARADFLVDDAKWECLRSAKILLNLHRQDSAYFEWVRVLEGIANGCVLVSEHSPDCRPLVPGEHFVSGTLENLALLADQLLWDDGQLAAMRLAAYDHVRTELPMRPAAERLIAIAERLARSPRSRGKRVRAPRSSREASRHRLRTYLRSEADPRLEGLYERQWSLGEWGRRSDAVLKRLVIGQIELNRRLASHEATLRREDPEEIRVVARTPSYSRTAPRVSVLIPLYNHVEEVRIALESVAASEYESLEVVVLDDASTDRSQEAALDFFAEHAHLPGMLLQHIVNRGLGRTRNDLVAAARGELVFMLDADNEIYPTALSRLVEALDDEPAAFFAYPMLEEHVDGEPDTLRSFMPWEPGLLAESNYIDAMSLLRRQELLQLGGYTEDPRLHGWEDYDLWCRTADRGLRGVLVPEILARYRRAAHSMLYSITNVDTSEAQSLLATRYPSLAAARLEDEP
ncbi:MAG: glycosyltransferase [Actinomycetota bacterium]|nr:glycosyltransferase [Actinomycetota bacterium]